MSSEPTIVSSANPNGTATPLPSRSGPVGGAAGGTFGVKTGLAQMLKGG